MNRRTLASLCFAAVIATATGTAVNAGGHQAAEPKQQDIVATAVAAGSFSTLVAAVEAAGLVETLQGPGPFTVWAPTDEAFAALPEGTVEDLLKPENLETLKAVLLYHVVPGAAKSEQIRAWSRNGTKVETVQGDTIEAVSTDSSITINGANVLQADVFASNGVIHVIDTVLLPPAS
jgi:uncharacterized surface protein with fasciclin (FAS1) repeats